MFGSSDVKGSASPRRTLSCSSVGFSRERCPRHLFLLIVPFLIPDGRGVGEVFFRRCGKRKVLRNGLIYEHVPADLNTMGFQILNTISDCVFICKN
ncbi:hypothetical protein TNCV_1040461 [Trichonephila clavipes]|nr:hypothetical protein TNCV_1040461 [Trichonephila clavipes]